MWINLFAVIIGVLFAEYIKVNLTLIYICLFITSVTYFYLHIKHNKWFTSFFFSIILLLTSIINTQIRQNPQNIMQFENKICNISGVVVETPKDRLNKKYIVKSSYIDNRKIKQRILVRVESEKNIKIGDRIVFRGSLNLPDENMNPKQFNYRNYLKSKNIYFTSNSLKNTIKENETTFFYKLKSGFYTYVENLFDKNLSKNNSSFAKSVVLAKTEYIDDEIQSFREVGISHILAVSGLHIGIIIFFIYKVLKTLGLDKNKIFIINIFILIFYLFLIDFPPGAVRATAMYTLGITAYFLKVRLNHLVMITSLAIAYLFYNPFLIYNLSFILSFISYISIFIIYPKIRKYAYPQNFIKDSISLTIAINMGILPINLSYFNRINLLSLLSNLFLVPLYSLGILLCFAMITLGGVKGIHLNIIANITESILDIANKLIEILLKINTFNIYGPSPSLLYIIFFYFILYLTLNLSAFKNISALFSKIVTPYLIYVLLTIVLISKVNESKLKIEYLYVGQGDCTIVSYKGSSYLIDTGGSKNSEKSPGEIYTLNYLQKMGIRHIKGIFISHFDSDHVEGIVHLIPKIKIDKVYINKHLPKNSIYRKIVDSNIPIIELKEGNTLSFDEDVNIKVKNSYIENRNDNDNSMVLLLEAFNNKFLFTGDISREVENNLDLPKVTVLKVGHHGSETSTSLDLLEKTQPKLAVISSGIRNSYGHPNINVLKNLKKADVKTLRTDVNGLINVEVTGEKINISAFKNQDKSNLINFILINFGNILVILIKSILLIVISKKITWKDKDNDI